MERNEASLQTAVAQQPVSAAIDTNNHKFMYYTSGVQKGKKAKKLNQQNTFQIVPSTKYSSNCCIYLLLIEPTIVPLYQKKEL